MPTLQSLKERFHVLYIYMYVYMLYVPLYRYIHVVIVGC